MEHERAVFRAGAAVGPNDVEAPVLPADGFDCAKNRFAVEARLVVGTAVAEPDAEVVFAEAGSFEGGEAQVVRHGAAPGCGSTAVRPSRGSRRPRCFRLG